MNVLELLKIENDQQHEEQFNSSMKRINEAMTNADESRRIMQDKIKENDRLSQELSELRLKFEQERNSNSNLNHEISVLKQRIQLMNGSQELLETQKLHRDELIERLREAQSSSNALNKIIDDLRIQLHAANKQKETIEKLMLKK